MISEGKRKKLILERSRRVNAGDLDGLLEMFTEDVRFEDPVGSGVRTGRDELRKHLEALLAAGVREELGLPVAGQDGQHVLVPVTAVMDYLPMGPVYAEQGWLDEVRQPQAVQLRTDQVIRLRVTDDGRIAELKAYWGRCDLSVVTPDGEPVGGPSTATPADENRRRMSTEYVRRLNAGDIDGVVSLFVDDIVFEDPVGRPPLVGKGALHKHITWAVEGRTNEVPGRPVVSMDGRYVVTPVTVTVHEPRMMVLDIIGIVEVGEDGLGRRVRAYWGVTDMTLGYTPKLDSVAQLIDDRAGAPAPVATGDPRSA